MVRISVTAMVVAILVSTRPGLAQSGGSYDLSWHTVVTVALLAIQNGQNKFAKTTLNWIIATHQAYPELVKPTALAQAEHFIKQL